MAEDGSDLRTVCVVVLTCVVGTAGLYLGAEFLAPIGFALVLTGLFRPVVSLLERRKVPAALSAAAIVLSLFGLGVVGSWALVKPIQRAVAKAPETLAAADEKLSRFREPVKKVADVTQKVEQAVGGGGATTGPSTSPSASPESPEPAPPAPQSAPVSPFKGVGRLIGSTTQVIGEISEILLLLFLLLASGDLFKRKLRGRFHDHDARARAMDAVHESEAVILRYLGVTALINLGQAVVVALCLWALHMPVPILFGALTFVVEFVPYLGAAVMIVSLTVAGLAKFDTLGHILAPPLLYLLITTLQNNLVSPFAYGKRLKLNAVTVLVGVLYWWFVWGIPGAFLAVPLLAMTRIVAERVPRLRGLAEFMTE